MKFACHHPSQVSFPIKEEQIFRLPGVPMGFRVTMIHRWEWVLEKLKSKAMTWQNFHANLLGCNFVLYHYTLPSIVYFLAC